MLSSSLEWIFLLLFTLDHIALGFSQTGSGNHGFIFFVFLISLKIMNSIFEGMAVHISDLVVVYLVLGGCSACRGHRSIAHYIFTHIGCNGKYAVVNSCINNHPERIILEIKRKSKRFKRFFHEHFVLDFLRKFFFIIPGL